MFAVFSVLGGAAAFEVRRRTAVTNDRRQLRKLREDRNGLDALLQELKGELSTVLGESASNRAAFEAIQSAAAALEQRCNALATANEELTAEKAGLAGENAELRATNAQLTANLAAVEAERATERAELAEELEALKEEVKAAVEEYVDGVLSADNLRARLENMGVEVKFIEGDKSGEDVPAVDDSWLLKLRSAFEPEQAAKLLSMGAGMEALNVQPAAPARALSQRQHVEKAERVLAEQQARMQLGTSRGSEIIVPQKSTTATLVNEKENSGRVGTSTAASRKHATVATKAIGESGTGLSFQLCDESKTQQKFQPSLKPRRGSFQKPLAPAAASISAVPLQDATNVRGLEFSSAATDMGGAYFSSRSTDVVLR